MKVKLWISLVLAFFVFIFITQNTEMVDVQFLLWSVEMSIILLVFILFGTGVIIGWLLHSYIRYVMKKSREKSTAAMPIPDKRTTTDNVEQAKTSE